MQYQKGEQPTKIGQSITQRPLANSDAFASFSVKDLDQAREFYQDILGIETDNEQEMGFSMNCGEASIFVYPKENHTPATFTVLNFEVDDIEKTVTDLKSLGVKFEMYGGEIKTDADCIHRGKGHQLAWFKDPSGNILSVIQEDTVAH